MDELLMIQGPLSRWEESNLDMMLHPQRWPSFELPLKRAHSGGLQAAYMFWLDAEYAVFVEGNVWETRPEVRRKSPRRRLRRHQLRQVVLSGWRVD